MSKIRVSPIEIQPKYLLETRFLQSFKTKKSRFSLVFSVENVFSEQKINSELKLEDLSSLTVTNVQLGEFFTNRLLDVFILPYQTKQSRYLRLNFKIATKTTQVLQTAKYEIPYKIGKIHEPQQNPNLLLGDYTCRFSNENNLKQLTLRIKNVVGPIQSNYFINEILDNKFVLRAKSPLEDGLTQKIQFQFCGLTLNAVYSNIGETFDEILESITERPI
uniref:Uncharacterized protein n=1 Tax=Flabellia petiolata TaxID=189428 RepID=A0A386AX84_9CHLO|nr:hypothetical protein [Flabellia petiolata]